MDKTDSTILSILKENSRASASDISKQVSLSVPAVTERIRKLEQTGVIEKYTIRVNPGASGYNLLAFILVKMDYSRNICLLYTSILYCPNCGEKNYLEQLENETPENDENAAQK